MLKQCHGMRDLEVFCLAFFGLRQLDTMLKNLLKRKFLPGFLFRTQTIRNPVIIL